MPTIRERPGMYAPLPRQQQTHTSPQAVRIHQAQQTSSTPSRSTSAQRRTGSAYPVPVPAWGMRADTPQRDVPRWEPQRAYTAIRNYSRSPSRSRGRVSIPEWVYEIDARHRADEGGECATVTVESTDIGTSTGKRQARRDSATPTHAELFFGEDGKEGEGRGYESRSDAYRNLQTRKPAMGSAVLDAQIHMQRREATNTQLEMASYTVCSSTEPYQLDTTTVLTQPHSYQSTTMSLRRLSLRLPATPPLSEDMFDAITGELDVENVVGCVTANMRSEREISEVSVNECLERGGEVVEEKGKEKEEEDDDFRWIRAAIRRS